MVNLSNVWASRGRDVCLLTLSSPASDFYPVHSRVARVGLGVLREIKRGPVYSALARRHRLRAAISQSQPDAVISFMLKMNVLTLEASRGLGVPIVVSERVDPAYPFGWHWSLFRRLYYRRAAALVVQTQAAARAFDGLHRAIHVVSNPVPAMCAERPGINSEDDARPAHRRPTSERGTILAVGRLHVQKGFDQLLTACKPILGRHPGWVLRIVGEGPMRAQLEAQVRQLDLVGRVSIPGEVKCIASEYQAADLFVMSSRQEGFPNALVEAMAMGLPVVSFDCPSGPGEIIRDGHDGRLVPNGDMGNFSKVISGLIAAPAERQRLGQAATQVVHRFDPQTVADQWDEVIDSALRNRSPATGDSSE